MRNDNSLPNLTTNRFGKVINTLFVIQLLIIAVTILVGKQVVESQDDSLGAAAAGALPGFILMAVVPLSFFVVLFGLISLIKSFSLSVFSKIALILNMLVVLFLIYNVTN